MSLKIKLKQIDGVPTTSDLEDKEIGIDTANNNLYVNFDGVITNIGGGQIDFGAVGEDILPTQDSVWNLGSESKRWAELYLAGNTINLGGAVIDSDGTGAVSISGAGMTIPDNSRNASGDILATASEGGGGTLQVTRNVDFFTAAQGLDTINTRFKFNATIDDQYTYTGTKTFTLANGDTLSNDDITLFQF